MIYKVSSEKAINDEGNLGWERSVRYVIEEDIKSITSMGEDAPGRYCVHFKSEQSYSIDNVARIESV